MPVIRSPPQRAMSTRPRAASIESENDETLAVAGGQQQPHQTLQMAKKAGVTARRNSKGSLPGVTILADTTTRIWELEGEVSKLERDKRFFEEERRKLVEERELEVAELKRESAVQLEQEKRRSQKELEQSNAQWREELEETNARHERKDKDHERRLGQVRADVEADFQLALGNLEREKARFKTQCEVLEADVSAHRQQRSDLEQELKDCRVQVQESKAQHALDVSVAVEAVRAELRLQHAREVSELLERSRQELREAHLEELTQVQARHVHENQTRTEDRARSQTQQDVLIKAQAKREQDLLAVNEALRAQLRQEQEDRAKEERKRMVEMELAQQRTDEAVARALSIVRRTEDKIAMSLTRELSSTNTRPTNAPSMNNAIATRSTNSLSMNDNTTTRFAAAVVDPTPPPPPSRYRHKTVQNSRRESLPASPVSRRRASSGLAADNGRRRASIASPQSYSPGYLSQTKSSLARTDYDFRSGAIYTGGGRRNSLQ